uniref:L-threonylcarbamoyladenylate synthase n=1 Tax=Caldiarchaeum subterraneum TaxID=311458 RepID=A0A7C5Q571_CALS0
MPHEPSVENHARRDKSLKKSSNLLQQVEQAAEIVERGGVIVYPTDTVYGIGCNPFDAKAVRRVMEIKSRENKPSPVLVSGLNQLNMVADPLDMEVEAALRVWPGPVTIVMRKKPNLPDEVTAGEPTVGVRMPANAIALAIMQRTGLPLLGTSANLSGMQPAVTAQQVDEKIKTRVDMVLDGGKTLYQKASTVVRLSEKGLVVIREGVLSEEEVRRRLFG